MSIYAVSASGAAEASEDKAKEWYNNAMVAAPAAILALGGAAKAGLFGEKVEGYADSVTDKVVNLFGKKDAAGISPLQEMKEALFTISNYSCPLCEDS